MYQPDWSALEHAYGAASDIPTAPAPETHTAEPWFSLWSALYHQDDIYPASYAALPELVRIADVRHDAARTECLFLAALIELGRHDADAPAMPSDLRMSYEAAVQGARRTVHAALAQNRNVAEARQLEIAAAVFHGRQEVARELLELDD